ncbi:hypothetical protein V5P93_003356 [Actinokineospora auranticolor]|nr:hypothetical protein [Actinokineospora auranticolor]
MAVVTAVTVSTTASADTVTTASGADESVFLTRSAPASSPLGVAINKVQDSYARVTREFDTSTAEAAQGLARRVESEVTAGTIGLHVPAGTTLAYGAAKGYQSDRASIVMIPLSHPSLVAPSVLSVSFNANGARQNYTETQFQPLSADSGNVFSWTDGALKVSKTAYSDGRVTEVGAAPGKSALNSVESSWFDRFLDCMSRMGVSSWIIAGIAVICGAVCIATAGLACTACIVAAYGSLGGVVSFCAAEAG